MADANVGVELQGGDMARAIVIVLDSVGIGGAPDAARFGDQGSDTLGHIAAECAAGRADRAGVRSGALKLPNLERLGLGLAAELATGAKPAGFSRATAEGRYAAAAEVSSGKDTPSGHWEMAGLPVLFDWGYFRARGAELSAGVGGGAGDQGQTTWIPR